MRQTKLLLLICGILLESGAAAEIYRWTDEQGRVHYGDRPSPEATQVQQVPAPSQPPTRQAAEDARDRAQRRLLEVYREERLEKQSASENLRRQQAVKEERCRQARARLARLSRTGLIYQQNDRGDRTYLDPQARQDYLNRLQADLDRWCGD